MSQWISTATCEVETQLVIQMSYSRVEIWMTGCVTTLQVAVQIHWEINIFPVGVYTDENTKYWSHSNAI